MQGARPISSFLAALAIASAALAADAPAETQSPSSPVSSAAARERTQPLAPAPRPGADPAAPVSLPEPGSWSALTSTALPLAMVLGIILLGAGVLRRVVAGRSPLAAAMGSAAPSPSGILEVLGRYPVARGSSLVLLKLDQRVLLLSHAAPTRHHPGGFAPLAEITDPQDVASLLLKVEQAQGTSLNEKFRAALEQAETAAPAAEPSAAHRRAHRAATAAGDRVELWDDAATPGPVAPAAAARPPGAEMFPDAVAVLRQRLAGMRDTGGGRA